MNSAALTVSGRPVMWLNTSSALELKSKWELLELVTLPLSHFSALDSRGATAAIWLHLARIFFEDEEDIILFPVEEDE
jgi:hypothetical protein